MIFVILIASINRKRMILMWLWSLGRDILKPSTSKWVFLEKRHQGGLGSSLLVYSSPAYKSWGSQINSFLSEYNIFDIWSNVMHTVGSYELWCGFNNVGYTCCTVWKCECRRQFPFPQPCFSNRGRDLINTCPYLIFVTNFTCETCGEISDFYTWQMGRNLKNVAEFQISSHDRCGELWNLDNCGEIYYFSTWQM